MSIEIKLVDEYPEDQFNDLVERNLESSGTFIRSWNYHFEGDKNFKKNGTKVRVGAFDRDRLIGLSWGMAESRNRFMMHMSLVEAEYRDHGIYRKMLDIILNETKVFDEVDSLHHIFNNRIISYKLKRGFYIIGQDQCGMLGPRIRLRYFHNPKLFEIMKYRVGLTDQPAL
ncbi:hypothetical protein [Pseudobacteriovorax antillogorgiicola]|uniref:N-acetyltransferase domain-containing protein n=1 Tax=Pseudobacteriovorax antillogorgiicola TaxID=1513793 RepID=A0A1Y6BXE1_9BACT|nr:hypothetical protein [Pseudobacteriovorax antillogorgiicola]TCS53711.1 hypothetical protein EDD56_10720 [Pseudobacteriovorax antillogorgiicola]SMF22938.1 hypothetical protein SAMN06296036_107252 [Pseudobacteriovorax antillogorgiicola]